MLANQRLSLLVVGLVAGFAGLSACRGTPPAMTTLAEANARFAGDLYGQVAIGAGNRFFSPYSISSALGMSLLGARGETQTQMQRVLLAGGDHHAQLGALTRQLAGEPGQARPFSLTVANALWLQADFTLREEYLDSTQRHYGTSPHTVDYRSDPEAARRRINDWVADQTRQKIQDLLAPGRLAEDTRLVLTNAIYFKSAWQAAFDANDTRTEPFHRRDGSTVPAPLMSQTGRFAYREIDDAQVLWLPYKGSELAMVVALPRTVDGLAALEASLTADALLALAAGRDASIQRVEVQLPRFRLEQTLDLVPSLAALGMPAAFAPATADFSGMTGGRDLYINAVVHKAFVEVDEQGTEAAAATAVEMTLTSMPFTPQEAIVFRADRPFLFFIAHQPSRTILFLGRLEDPS